MLLICCTLLIPFCVIIFKKQKRKDKIRVNTIRVKAHIMTLTDNGDEFAKLYDVNRLYDEPRLIPRYDFWGLDHLDIGLDLDEFWNKYEETKKKFQSKPRYKIYKLFLDNIGSNLYGTVCDNLQSVHLVIKKHTPAILDKEILSAENYYGMLCGGCGGGGSYIKYSPCDPNKIGQLKCPAFEKMRMVWNNVLETSELSAFIIKDSEIEDFLSMCQLISGEEIIC